MALQIEIGSVMNAFQFLKAHRKLVFDVVRVFCVVSEFFVMVPAQFFRAHAVFFIKFPALIPPIFKEFIVVAGLYEKLHFLAKVFHLHLFEFAGAEDKVFGYDFVAECFADLGDAERNFHAI